MSSAQAKAQAVWSESGEDRLREEEMLAEGGGVVFPSDPPSDDSAESPAGGPPSGTHQVLGSSASAVAEQAAELKVKTAEAWSNWVEDTAHRWGKYALEQLFSRKGRVSKTMNQVPQNMHRVANQTRLVLELIDDFQSGTYREIPWRSVALLSFALLYAVSPADLVPDALPLVGQLDDLSVIALATRATNRDLRAYCRFKGYDESEYFRTQESL